MRTAGRGSGAASGIERTVALVAKAIVALGVALLAHLLLDFWIERASQTLRLATWGLGVALTALGIGLRHRKRIALHLSLLLARIVAVYAGLLLSGVAIVEVSGNGFLVPVPSWSPAREIWAQMAFRILVHVLALVASGATWRLLRRPDVAELFD